MRRFLVFALATVLTVAAFGLALALGSAYFDARRYAAHHGRLQRLVQQQPRLEQVVAGLRETSEQVVAVSFMVAEGILRDRMVERCRALGVDMVPGALARTSALADLVFARTL